MQRAEKNDNDTTQRNNVTFWEMRLLALLPGVRLEVLYHFNICIVNMKPMQSFKETMTVSNHCAKLS